MTDLSDFKRRVYEPEVAALRARLAETEAQRDEALLVREGLISPVQKVIELQRQVATLESALRNLYDDAGVDDIDQRLDYLVLQVTREVWNDFAEIADSLPSQPAFLEGPVREFPPVMDDLPAPSQPAQRLTYETESRDARGRRTIHPSLTAEDAAYVARRATWERK